MQNKLDYIYESQIISPTSIRKEIIDDIILNESRNNLDRVAEMLPFLTLAEKRVLAQEGLWDRIKARGAQAVGAVKGVSDRIAGAANTAVGNVASAAGNLASRGAQAIGIDNDPSKNKLSQYGQSAIHRGQQQTQKGKMSGTYAKIDSYVKGIVKQLNNDLNKLGIKLNDPSGEEFREGLLSLFDQSFAPLDNGKIPPPLPVQAKQITVNRPVRPPPMPIASPPQRPINKNQISIK